VVDTYIAKQQHIYKLEHMMLPDSKMFTTIQFCSVEIRCEFGPLGLET